MWLAHLMSCCFLYRNNSEFIYEKDLFYMWGLYVKMEEPFGLLSSFHERWYNEVHFDFKNKILNCFIRSFIRSILMK